MNLKSITFNSSGPEETLKIAEALGSLLEAGDVVALRGEMGAGKTHFTKGIARGMGLKDTITSPTYILIHEHPHPTCPLYHVDVYRLGDKGEAEDLGLEEIFYEGQGVTVVEWAEKIESFLPPHHIRIEILMEGPQKRKISASAGEEPGSQKLEDWWEKYNFYS